VPTERANRLALNEAMFRVANERMKAWKERHAGDRPEEYRCECARLDCNVTVSLTAAEYEALRSDSTHFVVRSGHYVAGIERVLEDRGSYAIIEKCDEVAALMARSDPRTPPS